MLEHCPNRYKTQEMPDQATDAFLPTLQFIPADWFATNEMLENLNNAALSNDDIDLEDRNSDIVTFFSDNYRPY